MPKIQSNIPSGEDSFEVGSHKNIANTIITLIEKQSDIIQKQIIGLEGDWGTGKSNIIKIIENKSAKKYLHFTYDTWTHQEDLTRKSILQELIEFLKTSSVIDKSDKTWIKKENELSQKKIIKNINVFPKIKFYYILFVIAFVIIKFVNEIIKQKKGKLITVFYDDSINYLVKNFHLGVTPNWTYILKIAPFLLIFFGIISLVWNIYSDIKSNCKEKKEDKLTIFQILGKSFYWGYGEKLESDSTETINETEPSNQRFRNFLTELDNELKKKKKILIFTIDNSDRLSDEKIKNIWSTINIFFAESHNNKSLKNIWLIIPYDEKKINDSFKNDSSKNDAGKGLLDKTFAITLKVPPPLLSNWESFFEKTLENSFEGINIKDKNEEVQILKRLFEFYEENITPRKIINFINQITTYYIQNESIKLRYIAVFVLKKDLLLDGNINENIINRQKYLKGLNNLFLNDDSLEINLSKIIYGIKSDEKAKESLLLKEIRNVLTGKKELSNDLIATPSFNGYFCSVFTKFINENQHVNLSINDDFFTTITKTLETLKESFIQKNEQQIYSRTWEDYSKVLNSSAFNEFENTHRKVVENCSHATAKFLLDNTIQYSGRALNSSDFDEAKNSESKYLKNLLDIYDFISTNNKLNFEELKINDHFISVDGFLSIVKAKPNDYKAFKLSITNENLKKHFTLNNFERSIDIDKTIDNYLELIEINQDYDLIFLIDLIDKYYRANSFSNILDLNSIMKLADSLEKKYNSEILMNLHLESYKTIIDFIYKNKDNPDINLCYSYRLLIRNYDIGRTVITEFPEILNFEDKSILLQINHDLNNYCENDLIKTLKIAIDLKNKNLNILNFISRGILNDEEFKINNKIFNYFLDHFTMIIENIDEEIINKIVDQINIHYKEFRLNVDSIDPNIINYFESPFNDYLINKSNTYLNSLDTIKTEQLFINTETQEYKIIDKLSHNISQLNLTIDINASLKKFYRVNRTRTQQQLNFINRIKPCFKNDELRLLIKEIIEPSINNKNIIYSTPEIFNLFNELNDQQKNQIIRVLLNEVEFYTSALIDFIIDQNNASWIQMLKNQIRLNNINNEIKEYAMNKDSLKEPQ